MAVKSADAALKKWQAAMASGTTRQNYVDGINATTVNPMAEAATPAAMQRYLDNVTLSVTSGRRANKLNQASPAVWKSQAINFGAAKLAASAQKGAVKYQAFAQRNQAVWQQMQEAARGATGALEKIRAALNVQLQAAGKPTL
jgi:hypothetical protein